MSLSLFGQQLTSDAAIVNLMEDLGEALNVNPELLFLGGGNPARIPEVEQCVAQHLQRIVGDPDQLHKLLGVYQSPRGSETLIDELTRFFQMEFDWPVGTENLCITNGSQSAFFMLLNMLAGTQADGSLKRICFPMLPEYLGYADQGLTTDMFYGVLPKITKIGEHEFKYHVDFDALKIDESIAAICVSRPTNPSGNVISIEEMDRLADLATEANIPLIVDCAYGDPFPRVTYVDEPLKWRKPYIFVMSLSKMGLPGTRTGIVVAEPEIANAIVQVNTVTSLACGNFGPALMSSLLRENDVLRLCREVIYPFYEQRKIFTLSCITEHFQGLTYRVHSPEGAFFLWLWFEELPISSAEFYQRLKLKDVLIMDGSHFFFGVPDVHESTDEWRHAQECIRLTYCQSPEKIAAAIEIIADELRLLY